MCIVALGCKTRIRAVQTSAILEFAGRSVAAHDLRASFAAATRGGCLRRERRPAIACDVPGAVLGADNRIERKQAMARAFKLLVLAALAMVALSAVSAGGAQGAVQKFHCTTKPCIITGESAAGKTTLNPGNITVKCTAKYEATLTEETVTSATVKAEYTKCKFSGVASTFDMNGCDFILNSTSEAEATAKVDINCPTGNEITITAPALPCTIHIPPQTNLEHIVLTNEGVTEPTDLTAHVTLGNITIKATESGCAGSTTASLTDTVTLKGFKDNEAVEGTQVGLHVF